jgi:hypothetical protein
MLENLKKLEEAGKFGGEYFKVQNGNNIIRVLTEGVYHESEFKGKDGKVNITKKFVMFIIDRKKRQSEAVLCAVRHLQGDCKSGSGPVLLFPGHANAVRREHQS